MRFAVIVASVLMVATPSEASKSCMSTTEARQHFGSVHIYWHGPDHCWDATPTRHHQIQKVQRKNDQPKWQNSMSEMLADDEPAQPLGLRASRDARQHGNDEAAAGASWADRWSDIEPSPSSLAARWVDIAQVAPPRAGERKLELSAAPPPIIGRETDPLVRPRDMVLVCFVIIVLTLATIEVLLRGTTHDRPKSTTSL